MTAAAAGAAKATELATAYRSVLIEGVPHVKQKPDFCGEACAEMYLTKLGKAMDQDYVFDQAGLDPLLGDAVLMMMGFVSQAAQSTVVVP